MNNNSIMNTEDRKERIVDIYINAETVRDMKHNPVENSKTQSPQHTGSISVGNRSSRAAPVCLVLLYFLLLTAVIVLCVFIYSINTNYAYEENQLLTNITNIIEERDELLTRITNITKERDQLLTNITNITEERNQLLIQNQNLTAERKQLIFQKDNVTKERDQLKAERNDLLTYLVDGWHYYHSSVYIFSSDSKSWTESRSDCKTKGADLIIINNKEEQDWFRNMIGDQKYWIGLTDSDVKFNWKWVDGTNVTAGFWADTEPNNVAGKEDCALIQSSGWADYPCGSKFKYICEKTIFK